MGFDLARLAEQVVVPASTGEAFRYQRYDWTSDELVDWIDVPRGAPVILEGVFCLAGGDLRSVHLQDLVPCGSDAATYPRAGAGWGEGTVDVG